jgi:hypothetical protein
LVELTLAYTGDPPYPPLAGPSSLSPVHPASGDVAQGPMGSDVTPANIRATVQAIGPTSPTDILSEAESYLKQFADVSS